MLRREGWSRPWSWVVVAALAGAALGCDDDVTEPEFDHVVVAVTGPNSLSFVPLTLANTLGYFEGVEVEVRNVDSGTEVRNAVANRTADFGSGFYENTLTLQAQGIDAVAFVLVQNTPSAALAVRTALAGTVRSVSDLAGRTVGVSAVGSGTHNILRYLLRKANVAESAVTVRAISVGATAEAAVDAGQVDALVNTEPAITSLQRRNAIQLLVDARSSAGATSIYGGPYPAISLYATRAFLNEAPETTQRIVNGMVRALQFMSASTPQQIAAALPDSFVGANRDLYALMLANGTGAFTIDGRFTESDLARVKAAYVLFDPAVAQANTPLPRTYTNDFVDRVKP